MPPRRCVVQDCSQKSDKESGISVHTSPASGSVRVKWKRFVCMHRKNFDSKGTFGICSLDFTDDCFTRAVHVKGAERRLKPGSVPSIWRNTTVSLSDRSRRRVSESAFVTFVVLPIVAYTCMHKLSFTLLLPVVQLIQAYFCQIPRVLH